MIDLYYHPSPNSWKVSIMLEECGIPYSLKRIDISKGDQFTPAFLAINPNNRIPAIVDDEGKEGPLTIFESGAILVYLAEKTGRFLAASGDARYDSLQWLFWQMAGLGPMAGQAHVFKSAPEKIPFAIDRYTKEVARLYGVMNGRLADRDFLAGDYSIADMACYGWIWFHNMHSQDLGLFPHIARWFDRLGARDAVQRACRLGLDILSDEMQAKLSAKEWI